MSEQHPAYDEDRPLTPTEIVQPLVDEEPRGESADADERPEDSPEVEPLAQPEADPLRPPPND